MPYDPTLVDEAELRGYVAFNDTRTRITYLCGRAYTENFDDPEEKIRAFVYSWLIIQKGYPANRILVEAQVPRRTPSDRADIVVFMDDARTDPYLVVEAKELKCTEPAWRQAVEQGFGNANGLRTTRYLLIDRGSDSLLFDIQNFPQNERQRNRLGDREALAANYGVAQQYRLIAGSDTDICAVDPRTLETKVRRAHAAIWAGGKRDPLTAFDEWSKLLFAKIWDERHTPSGQPRDFQVGSKETAAQVASRVRHRFQEARRGDPTVFADDRINLPDDKIVEVVRLVQDVGFTLCDIDGLGAAFEHFFNAIFRGDLGQYFTRRELVRFVCAALRPTDTDFVLDPTAGSGGFLLETLIQVWHYIDRSYAGQPDAERHKIDFALNHLFGIEIHGTLSRVCKTNLLLHKDGHTNVEAERSCLDTDFHVPNLRPDASVFTLVLGNPPFGDDVKEGDIDRLGGGSLSDFEISRNAKQVSSELVIMERALQFLVPGGRLGMVVPDGLLNNSGEGSRCPAFRRFLLRNNRITMIVSLPDFAFRKAGAQNKTSLIFLKKFSRAEQVAFDAAYYEYCELNQNHQLSEAEQAREAIRYALDKNPYKVFMAESDHIGYTPSGGASALNELYSSYDHGRLNYGDQSTILGQFIKFQEDPEHYSAVQKPLCHAVLIGDVLAAHESLRLDPKFHLFKLEEIGHPPSRMTEFRLGDLLMRREEQVDPAAQPDREFLTLTLSQTGQLSPREPGKGANPPAWFGAYFSNGSTWYRAYAGDVIVSQIDLWKGCVSVVPPDYDQAIVTQEFPLFRVDTTRLDPRYLALVLRSRYFQRAIRAITTGHSNRRRTQQEDLETLRIFLPDLETQAAIASRVDRARQNARAAEQDHAALLAEVEEIVLGLKDPAEFLQHS